MQIFSAYKKVERGGVRTLAFLHSFACFFLFIYFLPQIYYSLHNKFAFLS